MGVSRSKLSAVLVGLDGAGKTTIFEGLGGSDDPGQAFRYKVLDKVFNKTRFTLHLLELPGTLHLRPLWRHFYRNVKPHILIFVVDANDELRVREAKKELQKILNDITLAGTVILVLGNIKRQKGHLKDTDLRDRLEVPREHDILMLDATEPQELRSTMHHICQQLLQ